MTRVTARACANIALLKYWGKYRQKGNLPDTPSISLCLEKLSTTTLISRQETNRDSFYINGKKPDAQSLARLEGYLDFWRKRKLISGRFMVDSKNNFSTSAGLASSSSGYAALCVGLSAFCKKTLRFDDLANLARVGSGSAARSIAGGLAAMTAGANSQVRCLAKVEDIPWGMVIVEMNSRPKAVDSRIGMELSKLTSPYYKSWIKVGRRQYAEMISAIRRFDLTKTGEIMEANTLAMHACMIATRPPLLYWEPATVSLIRACFDWRKNNLETYFTIDAGPHVVLLARLEDLRKVAANAEKIDGVIRAVPSKPGRPAEVISCN